MVKMVKRKVKIQSLAEPTKTMMITSLHGTFHTTIIHLTHGIESTVNTHMNSSIMVMVQNFSKVITTLLSSGMVHIMATTHTTNTENMDMDTTWNHHGTDMNGKDITNGIIHITQMTLGLRRPVRLLRNNKHLLRRKKRRKSQRKSYKLQHQSQNLRKKLQRRLSHLSKLSRKRSLRRKGHKHQITSGLMHSTTLSTILMIHIVTQLVIIYMSTDGKVNTTENGTDPSLITVNGMSPTMVSTKLTTPPMKLLMITILTKVILRTISRAGALMTPTIITNHLRSTTSNLTIE